MSSHIIRIESRSAVLHLNKHNAEEAISIGPVVWTQAKMHRLAFSAARGLPLKVHCSFSSAGYSTIGARGPGVHFAVRRRSRRAHLPRMEIVLEEEVDPGAVAGTDLRVLRYPHPLLRAPNAEFEKSELAGEARKLAKEMLLVMYASKGVGLAAPQVGVNKRLMVFNVEGDSKAWVHETVLVNPRIIATSKASDVEPEACLSFPGMSGAVRRREWVKVEAYKLNGKKFKVKYEGWKARVFQHEYDHLDGVLYIDRLEEEDQPEVQQRLSELTEEYMANMYKGQEPAL